MSFDPKTGGWGGLAGDAGLKRIVADRKRILDTEWAKKQMEEREKADPPQDGMKEI